MPTLAFMVAGFYISTKKADAEFDSDAWLSARPNERGIPEAIRLDASTISFYFLLQFVLNRFGQMQQRAAGPCLDLHRSRQRCAMHRRHGQ